MRTPAVPPIERLDDTATKAILASNFLGVLGFTFKDRVDLEPISYVYDEGVIYGRTSTGTKLTVLRHHPWVALEVHEQVADRSWRSVVAHGTFQIVEDEGSEHQRAGHAKAVAAIRGKWEQAFGSADPYPWRDVVFAIHIDTVEGRHIAAPLSEEP